MPNPELGNDGGIGAGISDNPLAGSAVVRGVVPSDGPSGKLSDWVFSALAGTTCPVLGVLLNPVGVTFELKPPTGPLPVGWALPVEACGKPLVVPAPPKGAFWLPTVCMFVGVGCRAMALRPGVELRAMPPLLPEGRLLVRVPPD